jgi:ABC-type multidrug transport system ATPase subunit
MTDFRVSLEARNLSVRYSDLVALEIPQLFARGQIIAILGHNGAGKSTLIKALLGLLVPHSGVLEVKDATGAVLRAEDHMAFCPENGAVFADIPVESYLRLWCRIKHNDPRYYLKEGAPYVRRLSITQLLRKKGRELSKGQRRRVQTALGFMSDPRLFLFDEPFDGLDVQRTNDLMEIVEEERTKRAFLISSHRMDVMERLADLVVVLRNGSVASIGDVEHVCAELTHGEAKGGGHSLTDAMRAHLQSMRE